MQFIEFLGRGGFGVVDKVRYENEIYARKTFSINQHPNFPASLTDNARRRFIREAITQSRIDHPNIMSISNLDLKGDSPSFLMPVAKSTLSEQLTRMKGDEEAKLRAIMDILAGLEELHGLEITHRDLKPQNVLLVGEGEDERYVISDFGLIAIEDTQVSALTSTDMRLSRDYYCAPEISKELKQATPRSDIFSVGCILHDMYGRSTRVPCFPIVESCQYGHIIEICTRSDPKKRFPTVSALREAILAEQRLAYEPQEEVVKKYVTILSDDVSIAADEWDEIITYIVHADENDPDLWAILSTLSLRRIHDLLDHSQEGLEQVGLVYSNWIARGSFSFSECDAIANRLEAFFKFSGVQTQASALLALFYMGTSHNRWYVERKFMSLAGSDLSVDVARRFVIELFIDSDRTAWSWQHLKKSIDADFSSLHPHIFQTLSLDK